MKKLLFAAGVAVILSPLANAADYVVDTKNAHASINFKIQHLGFSWIKGRFNSFAGTFSWDEAKPEDAKIEVTIDTASVDTNFAVRNKHIRADDLLAVDQYPEAKFVSTKVEDQGDGKLLVHGNFTFHGVTKPLVIETLKVGEGKDPWGGYRAGFEGTASFAMADYGVTRNLGPASKEVFLELHIEGIKQ